MNETVSPGTDDRRDTMLAAEEARVLGCLMEKQMTTPEYYPLTLNALVAACNQKSSRVPVMSLTHGQVGKVVTGLRGRGLITARMDSRADRFEQHLSRKFNLSVKERAVLCVLMLRAAQTANEIRMHTSRMVEFDDADDVQQAIQQLMDREMPLVAKLPRASGQREERFAHLLCGDPDVRRDTGEAGSTTLGDDQALSARIAHLEQAVAELREEVSQLRHACGLQPAGSGEGAGGSG